MAKIQLSGYRCDQCGHEWLPRKQEDGKQQANSRVPKRQGAVYTYDACELRHHQDSQ